MKRKSVSKLKITVKFKRARLYMVYNHGRWCGYIISDEPNVWFLSDSKGNVVVTGKTLRAVCIDLMGAMK